MRNCIIKDNALEPSKGDPKFCTHACNWLKATYRAMDLYRNAYPRTICLQEKERELARVQARVAEIK